MRLVIDVRESRGVAVNRVRGPQDIGGPLSV
jgi:hypothetical protein